MWCVCWATIVKPAETAVARNGSVNTPVTTQWLSSHHVKAITDTHWTTEGLLEVVFSVQSMSRLHNKDQLPLPVSPSTVRVQSPEKSLETVCRQTVSWELQKLVADRGDSLGTQRMGNVRRWKPLPSSIVKTVTENTSLFETVICKVQS
jgi:hypothetical protein